MKKPTHYIQIIEVGPCRHCSGTGIEAGEQDMPCLTCHGSGSMEQEHKIASVLDWYDLLCNIRRQNERFEIPST